MAVATQVNSAVSIEAFLNQDEEKELLRFSTAGSVDDGKSTLIGRLLYDSKGLYEDQLASIKKSPVNRSSGPIDFSLLTDGLRAEREQGITIDVAYRYFSTPRRKFIIADTPGHEQYTRNMATGASTAELAVILIDARNGVLPQSRRHAFIASLLGIPHTVVAVNKMDLVGYSQDIFEKIRGEFAGFVNQLGIQNPHFIPLSALEGDNVVKRSSNMPWFERGSLLEYLEGVPVNTARDIRQMRFPVQYVIRPNLDFRGFAGQVASGFLRPGDAVMALPSGRTTRIKSVVTYDGDLPEAFAPMSVTVCLEDEIDLSRGDMLVPPSQAPHVSRHLEAMVVWMHSDPLEKDKPYIIKHTTQQVRATVTAIRHKADVNTLARVRVDRLCLNEIGAVAIETNRPLYFDPYLQNRTTGALIVIDPISNATVGAGMIVDRQKTETGHGDAKAKLLEVEFGAGRVTPAERYFRSGHHPATVWLTARQELAHLLERRLFDRGCQVQALADEFESGILPELTKILHSAGVITICSVGSLDAAERERARMYADADRFLEFAPEKLSPRDSVAVDQICEELERRGIIRTKDNFEPGEGI